jgi:hypothetical protein
MTVVAVFLGVLIMGSAWRLATVRLAASTRPELRNLASAMSFQY